MAKARNLRSPWRMRFSFRSTMSPRYTGAAANVMPTIDRGTFNMISHRTCSSRFDRMTSTRLFRQQYQLVSFVINSHAKALQKTHSE